MTRGFVQFRIKKTFFYIGWERILSHCAGKISQPGPYASYAKRKKNDGKWKAEATELPVDLRF